ncbi:carbohydrate deacetylase [Sandaracinus amylolyticus]|uniref:carbohydrate deacetylase n=1 Tax=Sandaracinus amylolyticus TaxID=927083 RepID=UPI001F464F5F|nr:ChbG/HpnK family deacetylase [Sandaracinus amylolyticus]UJR84372.1 Hypothetical protein I5071_64510 [Sandaracinus amylolyticus]
MRERRRVIVTADDLGLCAAWDGAIFEALERGVVTSVSIVTTGATYDEARARLRARGATDVGVHLDLIAGRPLSPASEVPSLLGAGGAFPGTWRAVFTRALGGALSIDEVEREWSRQIERAIDDGLAPTHLDAHFHLHLLPRLFEVVITLARRYAIGAVRLPDERPSLRALRAAPKVAVLDVLARRARRRATRDVELVPARAIADAGRLGLAEWSRVLDALGPGPTEVIVHPGQSAREDTALRSPALRDALARLELTTFGALRTGDRAQRARLEAARA